MNANKKPFKTGLVLSGGGARGFAHIGVLKALNESGIFPEVISGSSAGSLIGAFYCDGHSPESIYDKLNSFRMFNVIRIAYPLNGFFKMKGILPFLKKNLRAHRFEELKYKLFVNATDFYNARIVVFDSGKLMRPLLASASIPILFKPIIIDGIAYVDSGLIDNLPVSPLENICEKIIGVNANPVGPVEKMGSLPETIDRTVRISYRKSIDLNKEKCDLYIEPPRLKDHFLLDLSKSEEIYNIGYEYARNILQYKAQLFKHEES